MKVMAYSHSRPFIVENQARHRPKTAQSYSYKKLTQILEGKYASINTQKMFDRSSTRNIDDRKKVLQVTSQMKKNIHRVSKNPSIQMKKCAKNQTTLNNSVQRFYDKACKQNKKWSKRESEKFVPYGDQQIIMVKTEAVMVMERPESKRGSSKRVQRQKKAAVADSDSSHNFNDSRVISEWKNEEQLGFSSLLTKKWQF